MSKVSEKYFNFDVYSEIHNKLAANELLNARPMPTQPTLQFVDAPEGYANGERAILTNTMKHSSKLA